MAGSASTLVAATMQMSGEYTQAYILDAISNSALVNLAIFIYVLGAIGFLISVAIFQDYKNGLWLILGPALWDFAVHTRNDEVNVNWMYAGQQVLERAELEAAGNPRAASPTKYGPPSMGPATVYVMWDRVVSGTVQVLGSILKNVSEDPSTQIFARMNIQNALLSSHIVSPEILQAARIAVEACSPNVLADRMKSESDTWGSKPGTWTDDAKSEIERALHRRALDTWRLSPSVRRRLCQRKLAYDIWATTPDLTDPVYVDVIQGIVPECDTIPLQVLKSTLPADQAEITCRDYDIWVWQAIQVEAELQMRAALQKAGGDEKGVTPGGLNLLPDWQQFLQGKDALRPMVASYAVKNSLDMLLEGINKPNEISGEKNSIQDGNAEQAALAEAKKYSYATVSQAYFFAKAVPYLQGALLYFLAVSFPLIVTVMLVPGMHGAIFTWMGAWAWVKSWDVMFYIVNIFSGVLSEFVLHKTMMGDSFALEVLDTSGSIVNFDNQALTRFSKLEFFHQALFQSLSDFDPRWTAGIISWIVAMTTLSIPVLTGILFLVGRASALSGFGAALVSRAEDAGKRVAAAQEDSWLRKAEIERQKDVRAQSLAGSAVGAVVGTAIAPGFGTYAGVVMGGLYGQKGGSVDQGARYGQTLAIASGRSLAAPTGDVLDPIEMAGGLSLSSVFYNQTLSAMGAPSQGIYGEYANSRFALRRNIPNAPLPFSGGISDFYSRSLR